MYALSRLNYSLLKKRWIEALVGLEYNADCWTLRLVGQRYVTSTDKYEMRYFVQLELRGLGGIGSSPLSTLEEGIPGYQSENPRLCRGASEHLIITANAKSTSGLLTRGYGIVCPKDTTDNARTELKALARNRGAG